jgi:hypothetical protein
MNRNDDAALDLDRNMRPLQDAELDAACGGVGGWAMPVHGLNLSAFRAIRLHPIPPSPC